MYTFPVMKKVVGALEQSSHIFVAGDSMAVRAYTPYQRDIGDLDLIFPYDPAQVAQLQEFVLRRFPECKNEPCVTTGKEGQHGAFLRTRFPIPIEYKMERHFIIDFHFGGSMYKGDLRYAAPAAFFEQRQLLPVSSVNRLHQMNLPVPSAEWLLHFKLLKFLGKDNYDVMSLLLAGKPDMNELMNCLGTGDAPVLLQHLETFEDLPDELCHSWEKFHYCALKKNDRHNLKAHLKKIKKLLYEFDDRN